MQQQINLYSYLPRPVKSLLSVSVMGYCYVAFVILLFILSLHDAWQNHHLKKQLDLVNIQLVSAQESLDATRARYPSINPQDLGLNVQVLEHGLEAKSKVFMLLAHKIHFSAFMRGLADSITQNAWLTEFDFASDENGVTLKGSATDAPTVEAFLAQLRNQVVFSDMTFELQELTEAINPSAKSNGNLPPNLLNFYITTKVTSTNE